MKIPKEAKNLSIPSDAVKLSKMIGNYYIKAIKNRRKKQKDFVKNNYSSSWGKVLNEKKWENYKNLGDFLGITNNEQNVIVTLNYRWMKIPLSKYLYFRIEDLKSKLYDCIDMLGASEEEVLIIELGCGWGRNLFGLRAMGYKGSLKGYELTPEAVQAANEIANYFNISDIVFEQADLLKDDITERNAIIFTYHCLEQIKYHTYYVINKISSWSPLFVLHFEPVPELFKLSSPRDIVNKVYVWLANYQNNILNSIKELENENKLKVLKIKRLGYYQLPVQETTYIVWK